MSDSSGNASSSASDPPSRETPGPSESRILVELARRAGSDDTDLPTALHEICRSAARLLAVDRVGVWLFEEDGTRLRCIELYDPREDAPTGSPVSRDQAPGYFEAAREHLALAVEDCADDPRTAGLAEGYLQATGVRSLLDAPVRRGGEMVGVVCHEMVETRREWTPADERVAGLVADLVAQAMEARDRRRAEQALRESERRYRELFQRNVAGVYRTTPEGEILEVNEACARMFGYDSPDHLVEDAGSRAEAIYCDPADREGAIRRLEREGRLENHESRLRRADGTTLWVLENALLVEDESHGGPVIEGTLIDITQRKELEAELERMAYHDALTGLANRRLLAEQAHQTLARARREDEQAAIVYIDLTRFKRINDTLGHAAGDRVLVEVARRLEEAVRESDTVARVGGDEFAALLAEVDGEEGAAAAMERLSDALEEAVPTAERPVHVDARFGTALFPDHAGDYDALLSAADGALTQTYAPGASRMVLYRPDRGRAHSEELDLEEGLREALDRDELVVFYQPIVRMDEANGTEGAEALLRWNHPERGLLAASEFIHLAERSPLVTRIDRWVVREAVRQAGRWSREGGPDWVSVNLSAVSLRDEGIVDHVASVLEEEGVPGQRLMVELTERMAVRNPELVTTTLARLQDLGVGVALDDFGTGHSALAYLEQFPASLLKMDGIFIQGLENERQGDVARAIIRLGDAVGMQVAAERIETDRQREWLQEVGCALGQGFWIGEPVPAEQLMELSNRIIGKPDPRAEGAGLSPDEDGVPAQGD